MTHTKDEALPFGVGGGLVAIKTLLSRDPCVHANTAIEMIDAILKEHTAAQPALVADAWMHEDGRLTDAKAKTARAENFHGWRPMAFIASTTPPAQPAPVQEPWKYRRWNDEAEKWELTDDCGWPSEPVYTTPPAAAVPEGWKLVPVEPTHGMVKAFQDAMSLEFGMRTTAGYHARVYSAMLATAPEKGQP
jgi:hypothetical protein